MKINTEQFGDGLNAAEAADRHVCKRERQDEFDLMRIAGPAISYCYEESDGSLWAGNGEYESVVQFCPYCGAQGSWPPASEIDDEGDE